MNKKLLSIGGVLLLVLLFFALNMLFGVWGRSARIDLTQQSLYTLSSGSKAIARSFDEPVHLTLYYSSKLAQGRPGIQSYAQRVREMLEEYAQASGGKIVLKVVDPQPFSEEEDAAVAAGLTGAPISQSETLYFGLVGTNAVDTKEVIPFFDPQSERFLEYDVSRTLYSLAHPKRRVVGVISSLPIDGSFDPMAGRPIPGWQVVRELRGFFTVNNLGTQVKEIPKDVDVLLVVHPKELPDTALFAIDQYVMKGGKMFVAIDPLCESDQSGNDPRNQFAALTAKKNSSMGKLFESWGIEMVPGKVAADINLATQVFMGGRQEAVTYVAWLSMAKTELPGGTTFNPFTKDDPTTGSLSRMNFASPGHLRLAKADQAAPAGAKPDEAKKDDAPKDDAKKDETKPADGASDSKTEPAKAEAKPAGAPAVKSALTLTPLIQTTPDASEIDTMMLQVQPDPKGLLAKYVPGKEPLVIAARFGLAPGAALKTAFPGGRPVDKPEPGQPTPPPPADAKEGLVTETSGPVNIIVVADADFMADRFWIQNQNVGGISLGGMKIADNGEFVVNALDHLSGSNDLIAIRARGEFSRPFDRVQAIAKSAEQQYRTEEQDLENKIQQAQNRISELQRQRPGDDKNVFLSPDQQKEIDKLRDEMVASRKQLRAVQLNLRRDIDSLGTRLKVINIGLMPVVVAAAAVTLGAWRMTRRKSVSLQRGS